MRDPAKEREFKRIIRHRRIRKKIFGTSQRPRLSIHKSLRNFQAQIIDDAKGKVLLGKSTLAKVIKLKLPSAGNVQAAAFLGEVLAQEAIQMGIKKVCFDRGGFIYHGRIKAFAEAARKGGLEF